MDSKQAQGVFSALFLLAGFLMGGGFWRSHVVKEKPDTVPAKQIQIVPEREKIYLDDPIIEELGRPIGWFDDAAVRKLHPSLTKKEIDDYYLDYLEFDNDVLAAQQQVYDLNQRVLMLEVSMNYRRLNERTQMRRNLELERDLSRVRWERPAPVIYQSAPIDFAPSTLRRLEITHTKHWADY